MPNENEEQSIREVGNRKKRYKKRRRAIIVAVILLLLVMGSAYLITIYNRNFDSYEIVKTTEIDGTNAVGYLSYGSSIVKFSKDGAAAIDKDGSQLWNGSFEMSDPIGDASGAYVVIADRDGNAIHIFDRKGEIGNITTNYDIIKVEVASRQGVVAALMEGEEGHHIVLYDVDGTELADKYTNVVEHGYPLDMSLSSDGEKLVTSYLSYSGGKLVDTVAFFNFGEVGQNKVDNVVGGFNEEGIIVPRVEFVNNDTVCVFEDKGIVLYSMKEMPDDIDTITFEGKIQSILYNESYVGAVVQADGSSSKKIMIYDLKCKKVLEKAIDFEYETIYLTDEEIIMYDNMTSIIMKLNGKIKFRYTFDTNIEAIYPINNLDRYYLANDDQLFEIQLEE